MPELPEVETVRRELDKALRARLIQKVSVARHDLRKPVPQALGRTLQGRTVTGTARRGKYIAVLTDESPVLILHLGMSGMIRIEAENASTCETHDHIVFRLDNGTRITFNDPRRFGMAYLARARDWHADTPFDAMGPEPLEAAFDGKALAARLGKATPIKIALLDQRVVAGVGNIYACEALYESRIDPRRKAGSLDAAESTRLACAIRAVLERAIAAGGSTLRDYRRTDGGKGAFQTKFSVYDREDAPCQRCRRKSGKGLKTPAVRRIVQSGRSTFFCGECQI